MSQEAIKVGEPYPLEFPQQIGGGLWPHLVMGGVNLIYLPPEVQQGDVETLRRQKMQVGVRVAESIPFFTTYIKRWGCLDGHLNPHQYAEESIWEYVEQMGNLFTFIIAEGEGRERTVRLIRTLGVEMSMAELTQSGLAEALEAYEDPSEVEKAARRVYGRYEEPNDLAAACTEKSVFGARF